jgi:hypothetical protein
MAVLSEVNIGSSSASPLHDAEIGLLELEVSS